MIIEKAKRNQVEELVKISKAAFDSDITVGAETPGGPPDYDNISWHIQIAKQGHLFAAMESNNLVGGAIVFPNKKRELFIGRIFIDPKYHRNGYGVKLMQSLEEYYNECNTIYLDTPIWNTRTNAFYRRLGYIETHRDKEFVYYKKQNNTYHAQSGQEFELFEK